VSTSSINEEESYQQTEDDYISHASGGDLSTIQANSVASDEVVVAAELTENHNELEDRIRQQIIGETARANVVLVEHGGNNQDEHPGQEKEDMKKYKPKGVKEKLFGDGKNKDVLLDIGVSPDDYIRKRDHLPWTVRQSVATDLWVATVQTDQKGWEDSDRSQTLETLRSSYTFSGMSEKEAHEAGLAMATPVLQSFEDNPICYTCKSKFAVFNRPRHCRNCGIVVCSNCSCEWSSKRLPATYQKGKSNVNVCLACDWSATNFQGALLKGDYSKAVKLFEAGNVNLRTPYHSKKKGEEVLYPIHMAILGGNVDLVKWLLTERFCPLKKEIKSKGRSTKTTAIETSKGRSPIRCAVHQEHYDVLKYLITECGLSLFEEDLKTDYRQLMIHLTRSLKTARYERPPKSEQRPPRAPTQPADIEAKVMLASPPISPQLI